MIARWLSCALLSTFLMAAHASAAEPKTELLWPKGAPNAKGETENDKPKLIIYLPEVEQSKEQAPLGAVVVCPGGGYGTLAMGHEGHEIARWLNEHGVAAFICDYRHRGKGYGHPAPIRDAQQAIRTVRARADEFGVDPKKVGILGFSAGGHLASSVLTRFNGGDPAADDPIMRQSCRPDFGVLCYPVIAFDQDYTHRGSQNNLLGPDASKELIEEMSSEKRVTSDTPPTFLFHTYEDKAVPPQNSVVFYDACIRNKVPAELHIFEKGQHGVGLAKNIPGTKAWPGLCIEWLKTRGVVK
jgi:acetyl esterase/lipase